ncbi:MAG: SPOR domain-containing protein, partial [candidate division Zixibacteria bacterium]
QPEGSGYVVQVAGCESPDYAEYLVKLYGKRGYEAFQTTATVDGQLFYRVRVGLYETEAEAAAIRDQLLDRYSVEGWIDRQ